MDYDHCNYFTFVPGDEPVCDCDEDDDDEICIVCDPETFHDRENESLYEDYLDRKMEI